MSLFHLSGGLIVEGDVVSLSPSLSIENNHLSDNATGSKHILHPKATTALQLLEKPISAIDWTTATKEIGLLPSELTQLFWFLNDIGGWEINRDYSNTLKKWWKRASMQLLGLRTQTYARRKKASLRNIAIMVIRSCLPIAFLSIVMLGLLYGANFPLNNFATMLVSFFVILITSTILHEYAHLVLSNNYKSAVILQRGLRLGILHSHQDKQREIASSLFGPIVGILTAIFIGLILSVVGEAEYIFKIGCLVAVFQLTSWLPIYGDGQTIKRNIMTPRNKRLVTTHE